MQPAGDFEVTLDPEQIRFFHDNGFLSIERITTDAEVEWLKELYDDLFASRAGEDKGEFFDLGSRRDADGEPVLPQILRPESKVPALLDTIFVRNARRLAAELLGVGADVMDPFGHMIYKPPRYGRETPWHQDEAYWAPGMLYNTLSVWMPLDPATIESGCMQFVPGSHTRRVHFHRHVDDDLLVHALETVDEVQVADAVACPIPAGGATFHHCRMLHYAGPNTTDAPRRAYIQIMNAPPVPNPDPDDRPWLQEELEALQAIGAPIPE